MRAAPSVGVLLAAVVLAGAAPASKPPSDAALVARGLTRALDLGWLSPDEADSYGATARAALPLARGLPWTRARELKGVLHDVALQWRSYTRPRALALFSTLAFNERWLADHWLPPAGTDEQDADGVVYRYFPGHGLVFHPLAEFSQLSNAAAAGDVDATQTLAQALLRRAVPARGGLVWEYGFPFSGGTPPWTSGMAQAVAAQALARAGDLLSDPTLLDAAGEAYAATRTLVEQVSAGPWIRLYSFARSPVLNAQLQTILSLGDYAETTGDDGAAALVASLTSAAKAMLPRFDTGYWSLYSLAGDEASGSYHHYVVLLLRALADRTGDSFWADAAQRFAGYETQPPILEPGPPVPTLYPRPADGYRDVARFRVWVSKLSYVTLLAGGRHPTVLLGHGWHTLAWAPGPGRRPGVYQPLLRAEDQDGHRLVIRLPQVEVRWDASPPPVEVRVVGASTLAWSSADEGTPWLALTVHLDAGGAHRVIDLGRRGRTGQVPLRLPPGRWRAHVVAVNSAGKARRVSLGVLPR
jgi:hypothetical protein